MIVYNPAPLILPQHRDQILDFLKNFPPEKQNARKLPQVVVPAAPQPNQKDVTSFPPYHSPQNFD